MKYFFTSDEHYGHKNIISLTNRPFSSVDEMDEILIQNINKVVRGDDCLIHLGDFTLKNEYEAKKYIKRLLGNHIFIKGSHDQWLKHENMIKEFNIKNQFIVCCHYPMIKWGKSHYGSWQLYGHCHGKLISHPLMGKQYDVGVDNNNFSPVSFEQLVEIMKEKPDNWDLIKKG